MRCSVKGAPGCSPLESAKDALALQGGKVCGARILKQHLRTATENTHRKHSRSTSQSSPRNCEVWFTTDQALHKLCTPDDSFLNNTTSSTTCVFGRTADSASSISRARTARRLNERISRSGRYCDSSTEPLLTSPWLTCSAHQSTDASGTSRDATPHHSTNAVERTPMCTKGYAGCILHRPPPPPRILTATKRASTPGMHATYQQSET